MVRSTTGKTYGGYADMSWQSNCGYRNSNGGWLYSLNYNTKHTLYRYPQYAYYMCNHYGPTWGGGHDLYINSSMTYSHTNLGHTYQCQWGYGSSNCRNYFAGQYSGNIVQNVEVYYRQ